MNLHGIVIDVLGRLLGLEQTQQVDDCQATLGRGLGPRRPSGCCSAGRPGGARRRVLLPIPAGRGRGPRIVLERLSRRGLVPVCSCWPSRSSRSTRHRKRPLLWLVFDGTDSMAIQDELPTARAGRWPDARIENRTEQPRIGRRGPASQSHGLSQGPGGEKRATTRSSSLARSSASKRFCSTGRKASGSLDLSEGGKPIPGGQASGQAVDRRRQGDGDRGRPWATWRGATPRRTSAASCSSAIPAECRPAGRRGRQAAGRRGLYRGHGAATAVDVAVEVQAPAYVQKDERATRRSHAAAAGPGRPERPRPPVRRAACRPAGRRRGGRTAIGDKTVAARRARRPDGRVPLRARQGRPVRARRRGRSRSPARWSARTTAPRREITVLDDFLRLLYVEYEPTWEWRFIKEVFHRDKLVGMQGLPHVPALVRSAGAADQRVVPAQHDARRGPSSSPTT